MKIQNQSCVLPCFGSSSTTRPAIDCFAKKVYYIKELVRVGDRIKSIELNSVDKEQDQGELELRMPSYYFESLTDLGWEGVIVAQLISKLRRSANQSASRTNCERDLVV